MRFFNNIHMSLKSKLLLTYFLSILIPIVIVQSLLYYNSTKSMQDKVDNLVSMNLHQTYNNLENTLRAYEGVIIQILFNEEVDDLVKQMNEKPDQNPLMEGQLRRVLASYTYAKDSIRSIAIYTSNGNLISFDKKSGSNIYNIWTINENSEKLKMFQREAASENGIRITSPEFTDYINGEEQYLFHKYVPLQRKNDDSRDVPNILIVSIDHRVINQAINTSQSTKGKNSNIPNVTFLVNDNHQIVSFPENDFIGFQLTPDNGRQLGDTYVDLLNQSNLNFSDSIIVNNYQKKINNWTLINLIDRNMMFKEMHSMHRINIITGLIALFVSSILILYFTNNISKSIKKVIRGMRLATKGHLNVQINDRKKDEISVIVENFNFLMNKLNKLIMEVKETTFRQKEAEIRALEAQINPHFIYNTLDSINWMAIEREEYDISQMLKKFAELLRYNIQNSNELVTIKEEIDWLKKYIILQQNRYDYSFEFNIKVDESLYEYQIHKLILQPFIENAITHGISSYQSGGLISIIIKEGEQNELIIQIIDNGIGMTKSKLATVRDLIKREQSNVNTQKKIGLQNVMARLNSYYGEKVTLDIESSPTSGTKITISILADSEGGTTYEGSCNRRREKGKKRTG